MSGDVWEWTNNWYGRDYYSFSPSDNPTAPVTGEPIRDGNPVTCSAAATVTTAKSTGGHGRGPNRNAGCYRGPDVPSHACHRVGFRIVLDAAPQLYLPVIIALADADVELTWTDDPANTGGYQMRWSAEPCFVPGDMDSNYAPVPVSPYADTGAAGPTRYDVVLGVDEAQQTVNSSNRVNVFSFSLEPGEALPGIEKVAELR